MLLSVTVVIAGLLAVAQSASAKPDGPDATIELHRPAGVGSEWPSVGDEVGFDVVVNRGSTKRLSITVSCVSGTGLVQDVTVALGSTVALDGTGGDSEWTTEAATCDATLLHAGETVVDTATFSVSEPAPAPPTGTTTTSTTSTTTSSSTTTTSTSTSTTSTSSTSTTTSSTTTSSSSTTTSTSTTSTTTTTSTTAPPPPPDHLGGAIGFGRAATGGIVDCEVTTLAADGPGSLRDCAEAGGRYVTFAVSGTIDVNLDDVDVASDTTIDGTGQAVTITGMFDLKEIRNVVIRNLTFTGSVRDAIRILGSDTVWLDHLDLSNGADGLIDITRGSTDVTISWSHFHDHDKVVLVNPGPTSGVRARVTLHHNWFDHGGRRYPSAEIADVHGFNNFYDGWASYGVSATEGARFLSEANVYAESGDDDAILTTRYGEAPGEAKSIGDLFVGEIEAQLLGDAFVPPYQYPIDAVDEVVAAVTAGVGPNP